MGTASCATVENEAELLGFDCGVPTVNELVATSFCPHLFRQRKVFKILVRDIKVGFFSVSISSISLDNSDAEVADYYSGLPCFGAVKLDYIAVDKEVQKHGIGSTVLRYIILEARKLHEAWPVRLLILDALRDKIKWYKTLGFDVINHSDLSGTSPTVQMYFDLMPEDEKKSLDTYVTYMC